MKIEEFNHLVVIETQKTKQYLFASPYLRETRGASVLLDWLNRRRTRRLLEDLFSPSDYHEVYLGGGSGRILFRTAANAQAFKDALLRLYQRHTVSARVAVEWVERKPDKPDESFADWVSRGVNQTQQQKLGQVSGVPILAGRWLRPCTSCGQAVAERPSKEHGEHLLCRACYLKRLEIKRYLYPAVKSGEKRSRPLRPAAKLAARYSCKFIFTTLAEHSERRGFRVLLPQDFDDIGDCSRPGNYMGFIYADGNRMGEVVKTIGENFTEDEAAVQAYGAFSEIVDQATREAAVEAVLETVLKPRDSPESAPDPQFVPAEFILAGGDDLILVVPAQHALNVAILFVEKFRCKTLELQEKYCRSDRLKAPFAKNGLTTSAGIVLAHAHYPASDLMDLSLDLMKLAKHEAANKPLKQAEGMLDFMVLTEASSEPAKERREREYQQRKHVKQPVRLTERPYTADQACALVNVIWQLKQSQVPRSKLKALYSILFQSSIWQSIFYGRQIQERLKVTGDLDKSTELAALVKDLKFFPFRPKLSPTSNPEPLTTPLADIIELYDFIHGPAPDGLVQGEKEVNDG